MENALINMLNALGAQRYDIDIVVLDQTHPKDTISLFDRLPSWIRALNAAEGEPKLITFCMKCLQRLWERVTGRILIRKNAKVFIRNIEYDMAFSYGEWLPPEFVACNVSAKQKFVWIHTDLDKALYINEKIIFKWKERFSSYIFVSKPSMEKAVKTYPFLAGRALVIHNICDDERIRSLSKDPLPEQYSTQKQVIVTVSNIRPEKNHILQVEVAALLHKWGLPIVWWNIGSLSNKKYVRQVKDAIEEYGVSEYFLLLGAIDNPYPFLLRAALSVLLSEYESWSMVITESKLLGIPIIASDTSGAREQITDQKTGIIANGTAGQIAEQIFSLLRSPKQQEAIRQNLEGFASSEQALREFSLLSSLCKETT